MSEAAAPTASEPPLRRDLLVMALVGTAHGVSHFFQLVLPPLFAFLIADFEVSYTELGVLMTVFFVSSGFGQPPAGFLVDRFGARRVLLAGMGLYVLSIGALALAPSFALMFPLMVLAGLGNCVFHPADFTLLNAGVRVHFLGRAFGVHTLGGNLGWALAPVFMLTGAELFGWRTALMLAAGLGATVWCALWVFRRELRAEPAAPGPSERVRDQIGVLMSSTIVLCFTYFLLLAAALIAVQNFLPSILGSLYATPPVLAGAVLTGFLVGAAAGVLCGGIAADRSQQHAAIIIGGLVGSAALLLSVAHVDFPAAVLVATVATAGFLSGITTPSRDLLVRSASPPGATGRVFGFVYSGLDVGSALAPVTIGLMLDHGRAQWALWAVALFLLASVLTIGGINGRVAARRLAAAD